MKAFFLIVMLVAAVYSKEDDKKKCDFDRELDGEDGDKCFRESDKLYKEYTKTHDEPSELAEAIGRRICLSRGYALPCIYTFVKRKCGDEEAKKITDDGPDIVNRICTEEEAKELRTTFLDSADLNDDKKKLYQEILGSDT